MGAGQSSQGGSKRASGDEAAWDGGPSAKDYYALLSIDQDADEATIRKAYRKLALQHHPDKNPGQEEESNRRFHLIQAAYEVLSDPQERAWYDNHKDDVFEDDDDENISDAAFEDLRTGKAAQAAPRASAPGLTIKHLGRFFDPTLATGKNMTVPSSDDSGFFGTYRRLFKRIADEEQIATAYPGEDNGPPFEYPTFGYSHNPYALVKGEEAAGNQTPAKNFYTAWAGFSSRKSFGWLDKYRTNEAPDRRVKRLMEKENKRARDMARKDYNDTVRSLVAFIRKRDPRFKAWQKKQAPGGEEHVKKIQQSREEANTRMREREAAAERYREQTQDWEKVEEVIYSDFEDSDVSYVSDSADGNEDDHDEGGEEEGDEDESVDEPESSQWTCVACDKFFQSEAAWQNHERSKKHKQEVQRLRREMQQEEDELNLAGDAVPLAGEDVSAGFAMPSASPGPNSKKAKKKQMKQRKAQQQAGLALHEAEDLDGEDGSDAFDIKEPLISALDTSHIGVKETAQPDAFLAAPKERPPGSFDVFGYGSLIFKPPPHVIGRTPGYIKGYARRFAQHSIDHRGTPERPGRVVTLISAADWHQFEEADDAPEGDIVWGYSYTIDPAHASEVKAYLDWREKNGYTEQRVTVWASEIEKVLDDVLVYVGLPDNPAFVGPSSLDDLALRIFTCEGPSGRNDEYLLNLAKAVRNLAPDVKDSHLFRLEEKVLLLKAKETADKVQDCKNDNAAATLTAVTDTDGHIDGEQGKRARRRNKDNKSKGKAGEVCNVCASHFQSRSKLFNHIRETGHAAAGKVDEEEWEVGVGAAQGKKKGRKKR
ncbi:ChaC-domain-containing protein [Tilletiaria anomala UBC 951]|uniref:glutathione-specific gamma-glutamylcyclotransferase n=1 Tax=Tilletiaria anomala (strain ATCC 24038 / CBS 436.72 / UBC 951) TaxID=1037660 RepID=A0A066WRX7_TILAU|nr:ChaC-domain-containing protein [Tilletiaria anomala UBC 951]KDN53410.1 ChaC-domain-containing protein [Tilletiaria anomala UBC 951]